MDAGLARAKLLVHSLINKQEYQLDLRRAKTQIIPKIGGDQPTFNQQLLIDCCMLLCDCICWEWSVSFVSTVAIVVRVFFLICYCNR